MIRKKAKQMNKVRASLSALLGVALVVTLTACSASLLDANLDEGKEDAIDWIVANSDLEDTGAKRPSIAVSTLKEVRKKCNSPNAWACFSVLGNSIWFPKEFQTTSIQHKGYAIHEAVHFLQYHQSPPIKIKCLKEFEAEAYRLQRVFYIQNKASFFKETGLTNKYVHKLATC